jgi:hypothetical protein
MRTLAFQACKSLSWPPFRKFKVLFVVLLWKVVLLQVLEAAL